jgi:hypothetical protein
MGFNFMYIGRDENTLNDTLNVVKRWDRLPKEMKVPSMTGQITDQWAKFTGLDIDTLLSGPHGIELQTIVDAVGKRMGVNLAAFTSFLTPTGKLPIIATRPSLNVPFGGVALPPGFDMTPTLASYGGVFNQSWMIEAGGISMNPVEPFMHLMLDQLDGKNLTLSDLVEASMASLKEIPPLSGLAKAFNGGGSLGGFSLGSLGGFLGGLATVARLVGKEEVGS